MSCESAGRYPSALRTIETGGLRAKVERTGPWRGSATGLNGIESSSTRRTTIARRARTPKNSRPGDTRGRFEFLAPRIEEIATEFVQVGSCTQRFLPHPITPTR
jgi:hypothetical protein